MQTTVVATRTRRRLLIAAGALVVTAAAAWVAFFWWRAARLRPVPLDANWTAVVRTIAGNAAGRYRRGRRFRRLAGSAVDQSAPVDLAARRAGEFRDDDDSGGDHRLGQEPRQPLAQIGEDERVGGRQNESF